MRSQEAADLIPGQIPGPPRFAARQKPRERAGATFQLRDDAVLT